DELAHLRRGDPWVRRLELVALGLYWWFPVAWWAARQLREAEEQCCDAWVVWSAPEAAEAYAALLVETVAFLSRSARPLPAGVSGAGPVVRLKRRLTMILQGNTAPRLSRPGFAGLLVVGAALLPGGRARGSGAPAGGRGGHGSPRVQGGGPGAPPEDPLGREGPPCQRPPRRAGEADGPGGEAAGTAEAERGAAGGGAGALREAHEG